MRSVSEDFEQFVALIRRLWQMITRTPDKEETIVEVDYAWWGHYLCWYTTGWWLLIEIFRSLAMQPLHLVVMLICNVFFLRFLVPFGQVSKLLLVYTLRWIYCLYNPPLPVELRRMDER